MIRQCQSKEGRMRNLLQPFRNVYATGQQKVLKSIVTAVNQDGEYPMLSKLLGEVEVQQNGHWVKMFPEDMVNPDDVPNNYIAAGEDNICDLNQLKSILNGSAAAPADPLTIEIRAVMKEKLPVEVIRDLSSIPRDDQKSACIAISEGVAQIAVNRSSAKGKAIMASALANDALPDDLRAFYQSRSDITFAAIKAKIDAEEIKPLGDVLAHLRDLSSQFRSRNREAASGVSAGKILNDTQSGVSECEDELSCER